MLLKAGVDISRLRPEIRKKLSILVDAFEGLEEVELTITSTFEGTHSAGSLHYAHLAIDIRSGDNGYVTVNTLKEGLGPDYDVVWEGDHIHIEYDPKPVLSPPKNGVSYLSRLE
ncbi:hypothetical protein LCGC14_1638800 [marine sediment metagenome]|uniref:Peptidase M15A C-terminal domain-containing protein n=1 Tax=marine sediment metagenome TaxID=412755 RepID=A0A0F9KG55_9ZZZZ